ncbi:MAG: hypothetical protein IBJ00_05960 [Alphaproteobacteria bacterium]|nr:hypothetical protein [Alphaproteobacteria bacterium]
MVNFKISNLGIGTSLTLLSGCAFSPDISDSRLEDRVVACSAGFERSTGASLKAAYDKIKIQGQGSLDFHEQAQSIIFSELPQKDRLKAYEDYIQCVEQDWNNNGALPRESPLRHSH